MKFDRLRISSKTATILFLASGFQAFGMYHVHATAGITEGGIFGALLLLNHWFALSPAFTSIVLNGTCYLWGWKRLGHTFILKSLIASAGYSVVYAICERFPLCGLTLFIIRLSHPLQVLYSLELEQVYVSDLVERHVEMMLLP